MGEIKAIAFSFWMLMIMVVLFGIQVAASRASVYLAGINGALSVIAQDMSTRSCK